MNSDEKNDPWTELLLGVARPFVDPETGEMVMEQPVIQPVKRKADAGYVMLNMEAAARAGEIVGMPAFLLLLEAARQWKMGNGAVVITSAQGERLRLTDKQRRVAVADLVKLAEATGWVKVSQNNHQAPRIEMTTSGMRTLLRADRQRKEGE